MSEVSIKFFMPMKVASMEKKAPREEVGKTVAQLSKSLQEKKIKVAGAPMGLLHEDIKSIDPQKAHYEVCIPISGKVKGEGEVKGKELEKERSPALLIRVPRRTCQKPIARFSSGLRKTGTGSPGPPAKSTTKERERRGAARNVIVEIQFPIRK